jgi:hypothetical protein
LQFLQTSQKKFRVVVERSMLHVATCVVAHSVSVGASADVGFRDLCPERGSADPYVSQT